MKTVGAEIINIPKISMERITILIFVLYSTNGMPSQDHRSSNRIPPNWKELITNEIYEQHVNQPRGHNNLFESDIKRSDFRKQSTPTGTFRNAIVDRTLRWERGIVPYKIGDNYADSEKQIIEEALRDMMLKTCIRFVPYNGETDYLSFKSRNLGCSSYIGRIGGEQDVDLMTGCIYQIGEVQHEVLHALGFYHEQSRSDAAQYVYINLNNVMTGAEDQFRTYRTDNLDMPYDYESIMHYGWNYFAKDAAQPTIIPRTSSQQPKALGNRKVMTTYDVEKVNRLYECSADTIALTTARSPVGTRPPWNSRTRPTRRRHRPQLDRPRSSNPHEPETSLWNAFKNKVKSWMSEYAHT